MTGSETSVCGFFKLRTALWGLLGAAGTMVFVPTLLGFAGPLWWVFDLLSHFRVQYFFFASFVALLFFAGRKRRAAAGMGLCAAINLALLLPYYLPSGDANHAGARQIRAISVNVNTANRRYDLVKKVLIDNRPDIVLLQEVNGAWMNGLCEIEQSYELRLARPREDNFGIVLYSRLPCVRSEVRGLGVAGVPSLTAEFEIGGRRLTLVGTHPLPPITAELSGLRNEQLDAVASYVKTLPPPKALLGDLNLSPWSYYFFRLQRTTGMRDGALGKGVSPTWPTNSVLLRIPIDLFLVSEGINVRSSRAGPDVGSDHFPLIVDFSLAD